MEASEISVKVKLETAEQKKAPSLPSGCESHLGPGWEWGLSTEFPDPGTGSRASISQCLVVSVTWPSHCTPSWQCKKCKHSGPEQWEGQLVSSRVPGTMLRFYTIVSLSPSVWVILSTSFSGRLRPSRGLEGCGRTNTRSLCLNIIFYLKHCGFLMFNQVSPTALE